MSEPVKDAIQNQYSYQQQVPPHEYGTFQGVRNYPPHPVVTGFPQPSPPAVNPYVYPHQADPGYAVAEGRPVSEHRLPCCGIGIGWFLFIIGFFLAAIPWYVGAFILLCAQYDAREKPGYVACLIAVRFLTFLPWVFMFQF
ncbi:hypothetical protein Hanom_Chr12g01106961 [Helianthus anomalus]